MDRSLRYFLVGAGLILLTLAAYWRVLGNDFITYYDDGGYVVKNPHVQAGLTVETVRWAFTAFHSGNWHPLTWMSHMIDYRLFGLKPMGHHLVNLLFHLLNTLLLLFIFTRMTSRLSSTQAGSLWRSAFVAALFAVHPLHVESVAWVAERKDVLSTFFWFLTLGAYVLYAEKPGVKRYLPVVILYALGLMAKPMLVTLPLTLLLLDYWPLGRLKRGWNLLWEKLPLLALAAGSSVMTLVAQGKTGAISGLSGMPMGLRVENALVSYAGYMGKMLWPAKLAILYPHPDSIPIVKVTLSAMLLIGLSAIIFRATRKRPYLAFGWLWYLITLLPVIGIVQVGLQAMADRYTYVPLIGLFVMIAWGVPDLVRLGKRTSLVLAVCACLVIVVLSAVTWVQVGYWQNSLTVFRHAADVVEDNYLAESNLGMLYAKQGKPDEAVLHYTKALVIRPGWDQAYYGLGNALAARGDTDEAIEAYKEAVRLNPRFTAARAGLVGELMKAGREEEAIRMRDQTMGSGADRAELHYNMGCVLEKQGKYDEAMKEYHEAVRWKPDFAEPHNNLAVGYFFGGRYTQAWKEVHLAQKYGLQPNAGFLKTLSKKMPDPGG